jgi:hypothetical protein
VYLEIGHISESGRAEAALRAAIAANPADSDPYIRLIVGVFAPNKNWPAAEALIAQGVAQGVEAMALYRALAQAGQAAGSYATAREALQKALAARPGDFDTIIQPGTAGTVRQPAGPSG